MKKILLVAVVALSLAPFLFGEAEERYLATSDQLSHEGKYQKSIALLLGKLPAASSPEDQAEIYWRLSRDTLRAADELSLRGASPETVLARLEQGEMYGTKAVETDQTNAHGFLWKAANIGQWGQTRGVLGSLYKTDTERSLLEHAVHLDPSLGEVWFLLSQLYARVPAYPISFGNIVYAVSLGRRAIQARKAQVERDTVPDVPPIYYLQLARNLARRNWSSVRRAHEQPIEAQEYAQATNPAEKYDFYEGTVKLAPISDKAEAIELVRMVATKLEETPHRSLRQQHNLKEALADLTAWQQ